MNRISSLLSVRRLSLPLLGIATLLAAACAGPTIVPRVDVPPATPVGRELPPNAPATTDEAATQRWLEEEANRNRGTAAQSLQPRREVSAATPTNEAATREWLDRTIEERRIASPDVPPVPLVQTIERTVYVDRPVYYGGGRSAYGYSSYGYGYGYDDCGRPLYAPGYYYSSRGHRSTFPVNTAIGAGLGAIIGHQSRHRGRGAAIGAGIGLLFDLAR